jgi:hypothetical protein
MTGPKKHGIAIGVVLLALGVCARADSGWLPEPLEPAARRVVHEQMKAHADQMNNLVWAVILLQYEKAAPIGTAIAAGAQPLNRNAPEFEHHLYFFVLQDQLKTRAMTLANAALARDGVALTAAFKDLSETCIHCHMVYLDPLGARRTRRLPPSLPEPTRGGAHE